MAYQGRQPGVGVRNRFIYSATGGQTSFSGADSNGLTLAYADATYVDVFLNGTLLVPVTDYAATTKTSVVLGSGAAASDIVEIVAYDISSIANAVPTSGGTFTGAVTVQGNFSADGGTIKLDGNYPNGVNNVALGNTALDTASGSNGYSVAIGTNALTAMTSGGSNVGVGYASGAAITTGGNNVAVGTEALDATTTGGSNVAIGSAALGANTTASNNTAVGYQAMNANTTGTVNAAFGRETLASNTTGQSNTAFGTNALYANTTASENTTLGYRALYSNTTGSPNVAVGSNALADNTTGGSLVAIGREALANNTTAHDNVAVGKHSLRLNTTGAENTAVGKDALNNNTTGGQNSALGTDALQANTTGIRNTAVGWNALLNNTTAQGNTAVGAYAGDSTTTGASNTFIGYDTAPANTTGANNTTLGAGSLHSNNTASNNTAVGYRASYSNTTGTNNTCIGIDAGYHITTGSQNTIIGGYNGNYGGLDIRTSSNNIVLSDGSGNPRMFFQNGGSPAWVIGNNQSNVIWPGATSASGSNGIWLEGSVGTLGVTSGYIPFYLNKNNGDGILAAFYSEGTFEGNISVSGSTVSYNGGHLARWSQLADGSKDNTLVKGTVMTNLDKMAVWKHDAVAVGDTIQNAVGTDMVATADDVADAYTEINEQLNCMAVSSVEGDPNVAGVFVNWDSTDDEYNDLNIAMTGDMVIRIKKGTTVNRGDLLMSAGDGTAKPQGDDIVRSKTIAKVTSTYVSNTYDDESYCVPCVLMAC